MNRARPIHEMMSNFDTRVASKTVKALSAILYLILVEPAANIAYRLYLFAIPYGFRRNVNHVDPAGISSVWMILGAVLLLSVPLWFFARHYKQDRIVYPVFLAASFLIVLFSIMRVLGVLITYGEYIRYGRA